VVCEERLADPAVWIWDQERLQARLRAVQEDATAECRRCMGGTDGRWRNQEFGLVDNTNFYFESAILFNGRADTMRDSVKRQTALSTSRCGKVG
jgi:hypothetical protein